MKADEEPGEDPLREQVATIDELLGLEEKELAGALSVQERERWKQISNELFDSPYQERRRHARLELGGAALVTRPEGNIEARATSISAGGLFLEAPEFDPVAIGQQFEVSITLPARADTVLRVRAEVRRVVPRGASGWPGVGVRFVELTAAQRRELLRFLRSRLVELVEFSREKYRFYFEHSADLAMLLDHDGVVREVSETSARLLGKRAFQVEGVSLEELCIIESVHEVRNALELARKGQRSPLSLRFPIPSGELLPVEALVSPVKAGSLRIGLMLTGHDRSVVQELERQGRVAERRLFMTDKLAALGQVTAGIAHDINNPLAYVLANLELLHDHVPDLMSLVAHARANPMASPLAATDLDRLETDLPELVAEAAEGSRRIGELVRDLRDFARIDNQTETRVDINDCLDAAERLTRNLIRHRARIHREYTARMPATHCNFGRLSQVFLNLLTNAVQSFDEADVERNVIHLVTDTDDGWLHVRVSDNGRGIPKETIPRLFEPFFSTRREQGGTGLGLAIAKENAESLGGRLEVESSPGEGSTFTLSLPIRCSTAEYFSEHPRVSPTKRIHVLVVDDDTMLLRGLARALRRSFEVTATSSPKAALERISKGGIDAVLCDVMMPEMSGMELHRRLQSIQPTLAPRTVFMTGGTFAPEEERRLARLTNVVLRKPIPLDQLLETLAAISEA